MKRFYITFIATISILSISEKGLAQGHGGPNIGCIDKAVKQKAENVKQTFGYQGYTVVRDAMVGMESETPFPVEVRLEKGHGYQIIFTPSPESKTSMIQLFDGADKIIDEKKLKQGNTQGYTSIAFNPEVTDTYLIILSQSLKHVTMCGSITIMETGNTSPK